MKSQLCGLHFRSQDKSKLTSSKSHDDETQLVSKKGKSGEVTTDSIPVPTNSISQNGSNIQTITIKPAHQPSMKHAKRPEDTTQQKQQVKYAKVKFRNG